ncbi:MAG: bifunctional UDP-N-acetylglucosamine diphosphorylase/glucosamine-1-phosphate N-acetyltransferase GlmU, partial [Actinomycetota bacterium]
VEGMPINDTDEVLGVNTREQLAAVREIARRRTLNDWSARGVTFRDASTVAIDDAVEVSAGVVVEARTILQGNCQIGQGALLGPDVNLRDSLVGARARVEGSWGALLRIAPGSSVVARGHLAPGEQLT